MRWLGLAENDYGEHRPVLPALYQSEPLIARRCRSDPSLLVGISDDPRRPGALQMARRLANVLANPVTRERKRCLS